MKVLIEWKEKWQWHSRSMILITGIAEINHHISSEQFWTKSSWIKEEIFNFPGSWVGDKDIIIKRVLKMSLKNGLQVSLLVMRGPQSKILILEAFSKKWGPKLVVFTQTLRSCLISRPQVFKTYLHSDCNENLFRWRKDIKFIKAVNFIQMTVALYCIGSIVPSDLLKCYVVLGINSMQTKCLIPCTLWSFKVIILNTPIVWTKVQNLGLKNMQTKIAKPNLYLKHGML